MDAKPLSPPQEKSVSGKPDAQMSPQNIEKAKNDLRRIIKQVGIDPQRVVEAGQMAEMALKNPKLFPVVVQKAIQANLISPQDVQPGGIDYKLLAYGITAGKMTQELLKEGKL